MANIFTTQNFEREVLQAEVPVLVDFWADWCGPCKMLAPVIDELAQKADGFKVGKVNVEEEAELAREYGIYSIPTVLIFKNGQVANKAVGAQPREILEEMLNVR